MSKAEMFQQIVDCITSDHHNIVTVGLQFVAAYKERTSVIADNSQRMAREVREIAMELKTIGNILHNRK